MLAVNTKKRFSAIGAAVGAMRMWTQLEWRETSALESSNTEPEIFSLQS
jgi:hypothetical protein